MSESINRTEDVLSARISESLLDLGEEATLSLEEKVFVGGWSLNDLQEFFSGDADITLFSRKGESFLKLSPIESEEEAFYKKLEHYLSEEEEEFSMRAPEGVTLKDLNARYRDRAEFDFGESGESVMLWVIPKKTPPKKTQEDHDWGGSEKLVLSPEEVKRRRVEEIYVPMIKKTTQKINEIICKAQTRFPCYQGLGPITTPMFRHLQESFASLAELTLHRGAPGSWHIKISINEDIF